MAPADIENDPWRLVKRANDSHEHRQFDAAIRDATRALELRPDYVPALKVRGESYRLLS